MSEKIEYGSTAYFERRNELKLLHPLAEKLLKRNPDNLMLTHGEIVGAAAMLRELMPLIKDGTIAAYDFVMEDEHLPECRTNGTSDSIACPCMDRSHWNKKACMERLKDVITKHATLLKELI